VKDRAEIRMSVFPQVARARGLAWLQECVLDKCPAGGSPDGALYAEVVLDECVNATNPVRPPTSTSTSKHH
jgi:hypothetical protein